MQYNKIGVKCFETADNPEKLVLRFCAKEGSSYGAKDIRMIFSTNREPLCGKVIPSKTIRDSFYLWRAE